MNRRFPIAAPISLAFLLCAGVAIAGDKAYLSAGGQCPEQSQAAEAADVAPASAAAKPVSAGVEGGGGPAAAKPVRNRPRWQSYLPGMIR